MRDLLWKAVLTAILLVVALWFLLPSARLLFMSGEEKIKNPALVDDLQQKGIKLGLDLQGGTHLVLEVDTTKIPQDVVDTIPIDVALEVIRSRVDQFGVSEPLIQKVGKKRIVVELPGIQNIEAAKQLVQETAVLEFRLMPDAKDVTRFVDAMDRFLIQNKQLLEIAQRNADAAKEKFTITGVDTSKKPITPPIETVKPKDTTLTATSDSTDTSGEYGEKPFSDLIDVKDNSMYVRSSDYDLVDQILSLNEVKNQFKNSDYIVLWGAHEDYIEGNKVRELYMVRGGKPAMTGDLLVNASWTIGSGYDPQSSGKPVVRLEFNNKGE
jgi:hypothetical protein